MQNGVSDWDSIVAFLSRRGQLPGYSEENIANWPRVPNPENNDVEKPYPFMIRRLMKNYETEVEKRRNSIYYNN